MRARALLCGPCLFALWLRAAAGQETAPAPPTGPLPANRPPEWSVAEGYGFTLDLNSGPSHEHAFYSHPGVSFRLGSRFEYLVEGHFAHFVSPGGYVLGALPLGGRLYVGHGRVLPYATFGLGMSWTNLQKLDELDQRFNFLLQTGVGVRSEISTTRAWTLEARLSHMSNAGMSRPNLGLNMLVFLGGFRFR